MNFSPEIIGVGKYTGELARWLAERGHAVEVVTAKPHYPGFTPLGDFARSYAVSIEDGVRVLRCPLLLRERGRGIWRLVAPLSFALAAAPALVWRAFRFRPDLVLCIEPTLMASPAALVAARLVGARTALHVQDLEIDAAFATGHLHRGALRQVVGTIERVLLGSFDRITTISEAMARRLIAKGVAPTRVGIVRNWIQSSASAPVACARQRLGIGADERVVVYAGHLGLKQDVATLLAALELLSRERAVRIVIAGEGPMAASVAAARARLPGLTLLPLQPKADYEALMAMADVHVLPQAACAADLVFPSKLGPMLATGRPVVVTADLGSDLASWLGDAALVVPSGDPSALMAGLGRALDESPAARAGRALALARTLEASELLPTFERSLLDAAEAPRETNRVGGRVFDFARGVLEVFSLRRAHVRARAQSR